MLSCKTAPVIILLAFDEIITELRKKKNDNTTIA